MSSTTIRYVTGAGSAGIRRAPSRAKRDPCSIMPSYYSVVSRLKSLGGTAIPQMLEARQFVAETKVDVLAPAVGNSHGMRKSIVTGKERKHLAIERIREIKSATGVPLTLHGGSGTADEDLKQAIRAGVNIVHINTELRLAWKRALEAGLARREDEVVPYKILPSAVGAIHDGVSARRRLFGGQN